MEIFGYFVSILIGISLGLIGGGGSILTVPILVYLFGFQPQLATSYSLCIVGITALVGAIRHYQLGNLNWKSAIVFGVPSIISLLIVRKFLLPIIPTVFFTIGDFQLTKQIFLMVLFAILMIAASISMIRRPKVEIHQAPMQMTQLSLLGILIGFLTGLLGAGGGFLIIPALLFFAHIPMKQAIGTSLLIIASNSLIGFTGDLINHVQLDIPFLLKISGIAIVGMLIGANLSKRIDGKKLKPAFGWFILIMGIYILIKELYH